MSASSPRRSDSTRRPSPSTRQRRPRRPLLFLGGGRRAVLVALRIGILGSGQPDFSGGTPGLFVGTTDSLGEQVQRAATGARVVKAYNTVGNPLMVDPQLQGGPPTMFVAGDDPGAKDIVAGLLQETGWEVADLGGIAAITRHHR